MSGNHLKFSPIFKSELETKMLPWQLDVLDGTVHITQLQTIFSKGKCFPSKINFPRDFEIYIHKVKAFHMWLDKFLTLIFLL